MSDGGRRGIGRLLAGLFLAARGRARQREREARKRAEERDAQQRREAEAAAHLRRAQAINAAAQRAADEEPDRRRVAELAAELEEVHDRVRRRRAEPPPTISREIVATPGRELVVVAALGLSLLAAVGFVVLYIYFPDVQLLGLCAGLVCTGFAVAAVVTGKQLVPQEKAVTEYHWFGDEESHEDVEEIVTEAAEGISRRRLLLGAAGVAGAGATAAAVVPIASLGPHVGRRIAQTPWKKGRRLVTVDGEPIRAADVYEGGFTLALPEGSDPRGKLGAPVNVLRFPLEQLDLPADRKAKAPEGIVAYSRICTHAGCAVTMYRSPLFSPSEPAPALVCPCHYSTFDPRRGATVEFGPAPRPLPQLPLRINARGELEADGDFYGPIGPSYGSVRLQGETDVR